MKSRPSSLKLQQLNKPGSLNFANLKAPPFSGNLAAGEDHVGVSAVASKSRLSSRSPQFEEDASERPSGDFEQNESLEVITDLLVLLALTEINDCRILDVPRNLSSDLHPLE
nr:unnamed protein product [Spirometra erinaceieuropaei]